MYNVIIIVIHLSYFSVFSEAFGSFVFYPCQKSDYAPPGKVKTLQDKWVKEEVKNTSVLFHQRPEANILVWKKRSNACSDSEKRDWIKKNEAQIKETLG